MSVFDGIFDHSLEFDPAADFAAFLKAEMQKWSKVIRDAGIKPEQ